MEDANMTTTTITSIPAFRRDPETGWINNVTYPLRGDGKVDWKKLIDPRHIVFNGKADKQLLSIYGKSAAELNYAEIISSGKDVDDKHLLVLLSGFIQVAGLRGFKRANPRIAHVVSYPPEAAICSCECVIEWLSNEEEPEGKTSYGTADATMENTGGWGYLSAMAGNRAFVRAVRQGLEIPILAFDEIAKKDTIIPESTGQSQSSYAGPGVGSPAWTLQKAADEHKITFAMVQKQALSKYRDQIKGDPDKWTQFADIETDDCTTLLVKIKESKAAKAK